MLPPLPVLIVLAFTIGVPLIVLIVASVKERRRLKRLEREQQEKKLKDLEDSIKGLIDMQLTHLDDETKFRRDYVLDRKVDQEGVDKLFKHVNEMLLKQGAMISLKADKLSEDDKFVEDAKLSNNVSSVAKHTAQKTLENALTQVLPTVARQELLGLLRKPETVTALVDNVSDQLTDLVTGIITRAVTPLMAEQNRLDNELRNLTKQLPKRDAAGKFVRK